MTISYNWLCQYLPEKISPEKLSSILTSIGLEVEHLEKWENVKGGLKGLVVGEVLSCEKHPQADKLKLTTVSIGQEKPLNIVCGAANVAVGQKVIVAPVGCTIYPIQGEAITLKKATIRGAESEGMICAEDEIGLGTLHDGIKILPEATVPGTSVASLFSFEEDWIYEIGLTPNRMDAMSHLGVAKDVCAYLSYHQKQKVSVQSPYPANFPTNNEKSLIEISVENNQACKRYCGILIQNITLAESPSWLQQRLKSIGLQPINNIVDITNFVLHETGQPLHAFDAAKIKGNKIVVKNATEGQSFVTLDEKERKLHAHDLMICNEQDPMCMAGVYGGKDSGVQATTKNIFLESAFFDGGSIRKTSLQHGLRTDSATRFEKGVDISNTLQALQRAATLMLEIAGGQIAGGMVDWYPQPMEKKKVLLTADYLKKISGKEYPILDVQNILLALGFDILEATDTKLALAVPYSKPDISIPADIVEEIMRIDGLDNIVIPSSIRLTPSVEKNNRAFLLREKIANNLVGLGFYEIFTNSISNSSFYTEQVLQHSVKMMNSLSNELNILRPQLIQSGLQVIAHNLNRKNNQLRLFEFGKTYSVGGNHTYAESNHLCVYVTGNIQDTSWNTPLKKADFYYIKGIARNILTSLGLDHASTIETTDEQLSAALQVTIGNKTIGRLGEVSQSLLQTFDVKQPVWYVELNWDAIANIQAPSIQYKEISKFPSVNRDLAVLVDKNVSYSQIEEIALSSKIDQLTSVQLFDVFESDKLGAGKKSMAVSFTFLDENKTLTDKEIDGFMQAITQGLAKNIQAEIRK